MLYIFDSLTLKSFRLEGKKGETWNRVRGQEEEGQQRMILMVTSSPVAICDGWVWRSRREAVYLKSQLKKICISRGNMAVLILAVDVCGEARLIHPQTDTAAFMRLEIAALVACDGAAVESISSPVGS